MKTLAKEDIDKVLESFDEKTMIAAQKIVEGVMKKNNKKNLQDLTVKQKVEVSEPKLKTTNQPIEQTTTNNNNINNNKQR